MKDNRRSDDLHTRVHRKKMRKREKRENEGQSFEPEGKRGLGRKVLDRRLDEHAVVIHEAHRRSTLGENSGTTLVVFDPIALKLCPVV